jgi:hypothetical protein
MCLAVIGKESHGRPNTLNLHTKAACFVKQGFYFTRILLLENTWRGWGGQL